MEVAEAHLSDKMELALSIQKHRELAGEWVEFRVESRVESSRNLSRNLSRSLDI